MKDIFKYIDGKFVLQENLSKKEKFERIRRPKKHQFEQTDGENTQVDTAPVPNVGDVPPPATETPPAVDPAPTAAPAAEKPSATPSPQQKRTVREFTSLMDLYFAFPQGGNGRHQVEKIFSGINSWGAKNKIVFPNLMDKLNQYVEQEQEKMASGEPSAFEPLTGVKATATGSPKELVPVDDDGQIAAIKAKNAADREEAERKAPRNVDLTGGRVVRNA